MKGSVLLTAALVLASQLGCARQPGQSQQDELSYSELLSNSRANLQRLHVGMDQAEVAETMGSVPSRTPDGSVHNPYETDAFSDQGEEYQVLWYLTRKYPPFTTVKRSQATPVILRQGKLIGWGQESLDSLPRGRN